MSHWQELLATRGIPDETPRVQTPGGGMHYYFSVAASRIFGLTNFASQQGLLIGGVKHAMDVRCNDGLIIVPPSYYTVDAKVKAYRWMSKPLERHALVSMPPWLIAIVNGAAASSCEPMCDRALAYPACGGVRATGKHAVEVPARKLTALLELLRDTCGGDVSRYSHSMKFKDSEQITTHIFRTRKQRVCPYGQMHHKNNFSLIEFEDGSVEYRCHSSECNRRPRVTLTRGGVNLSSGKSCILPAYSRVHQSCRSTNSQSIIIGGLIIILDASLWHPLG